MQKLIENIDKIHTTKMGLERLKKNLKVEDNPIEYCKNIILDKNSKTSKKGKNYYCELDKITITINSYTYTIITAHKCNK